MKLKCIILSVVASISLAAASQPVQQQEQWEWYLDEVVNDVFVGRNDFEYYYLPSASDMEQQRNKGEVTYFLNSPEGLSAKKTCNLIDRIMASYDDIKAMGTWTDANTIFWKEFRFEKNKFRFNVKREALDDGTYYVSVIETSNYYKSLGKKNKNEEEQAEPKASKTKEKKSARHSTRGRRQITEGDVAANIDEVVVTDDQNEDDTDVKPVMSEQERRRAARQSEEDRRQQERMAKRRAQEEQRAQEKAQKEADKQRKAEEKKQKDEEKRLKKEEEKQRREQQRLEREQARRDKKDNAARQVTATPTIDSKYHFDDVALWLSEKYDFTQTRGDASSCEMYSTAVKDVEMAKLAIKNALKGSNARMAVPWRLNSDTGAVETGYTVDDHVLVFTVGKNDDGQISITVTEVSNEEFELFKRGLSD